MGKISEKCKKYKQQLDYILKVVHISKIMQQQHFFQNNFINIKFNNNGGYPNSKNIRTRTVTDTHTNTDTCYDLLLPPC